MKRFAAAVLLMGISFPALGTDLTVTYQLKEGKKIMGEKTVFWSWQSDLDGRVTVGRSETSAGAVRDCIAALFTAITVRAPLSRPAVVRYSLTFPYD